MEYYYTDSIFRTNTTMYNNTTKITKNNWHAHLDQIGWSKLPRNWIISMNKLSDLKEKNCRYGIYNVPGDGNCFFHCISYALNEYLGYIEYDTSCIRKKISDGIDDNMYETSMRYYKIMKDANDFQEKWNPYDIKNIEEYKQIIASDNLQFLDHILLSHIIDILNINIIILNDCNIYNTLIKYDENNHSIILFYQDNIHFNLIGYFDKYMKSYFKELPSEIIKLKKNIY